jgi:hypothetical protein
MLAYFHKTSTCFLVCLLFLGSVFAQENEIDRRKAKAEGYAEKGWKPLVDFYPGYITDFKGVEVQRHPDEGKTSNRAAPPNDDECAAVAISANGVCTTGQTNEESTPDFVGGCATGTSSVWYRFTITSPNNKISITFPNNTFTGNVELILMTHNSLNCSSIQGVAIQCGDPNSTFLFQGLTNTTYWLQVATQTGEEGEFDICATQAQDPPAIKTGPEQDCAGAIPICASSYNENDSYRGFGNTQEVYNTCLAGRETNSVWYTFTVEDVSGGTTLGFTITTARDYDFALYDITSIGCEGIPTATPVRCNFSGTTGNTGLSSTTTSTLLPALSEGGMGTPIMNGINNVYLGQKFALIVDNWSNDNNGYSIQFGGTAKIFDDTPPELSIIEDCSTNTIIIEINEDVKCSSINAGEFTLTNLTTATDYTSSILSVVGEDCGTFTNRIVVTHDASLPSGEYEFEVVLGQLVDKCDNPVVVGEKLNFFHLNDISINASETAICEPGEEVTLTSVNHPAAGSTFLWNPGGATTSSVNVYPTASTTYTLQVTYGACTKQAAQTVQVSELIVANISPINPTICSGTTTLTASATINGTPCVGCTFEWSSGETTAAINKAPGTYSVSVTTSAGCEAGNVPSSTISLASGGSGASCDVLYVSPAGGGDGLTKDNPTDLETALTTALCTNTIIKMQTGTYNFTDKVNINSFVTIEGGYSADFLTKTSNLSSGNGTRLVRSNAVDGDNPLSCTMLNVVGGAENFRIQDLRIEMPSSHPAGDGISNYGIFIGASSLNYDIVRCYIDAGSGSAP